MRSSYRSVGAMEQVRRWTKKIVLTEFGLLAAIYFRIGMCSKQQQSSASAPGFASNDREFWCLFDKPFEGQTKDLVPLRPTLKR